MIVITILLIAGYSYRNRLSVLMEKVKKFKIPNGKTVSEVIKEAKNDCIIELSNAGLYPPSRWKIWKILRKYKERK